MAVEEDSSVVQSDTRRWKKTVQLYKVTHGGGRRQFSCTKGHTAVEEDSSVVQSDTEKVDKENTVCLFVGWLFNVPTTC